MASGPFYVGDIPSEDLIVSATRNGLGADLSAYDNATAVIVDPEGVTLEDVPTVLITGSTLLVTWPEAWAFPEEGVYTVILTLETATGHLETMDPILVEVYSRPIPVGSWASRAYVLQITRVNVAEGDIASAEAVISLISGRDLTDPSVFTAKDFRNLRFAIAWQAAHMSKHPDVMTDLAATSKAVGDVSVSYDTAQGAGWLAPLARLALGRVSWRQNRTVILGHVDNKVHTELLDEELDDVTSFAWKAI